MTTQAHEDKGTAWVVMGVSGCGKSKIGSMLADALGIPFIEGDAFHSETNVAKMSAGTALTDDDRRDWLLSLRDKLAAREGGAVLSCSSLKRAYRDLLRGAGGDVRFVHLAGERSLLEQRVSNRPGHYMPPSLLDSQLCTLEPLQPDEAGITLDIRDTPERLVAQILATIPA
ncbi:gluconokinase [Telluria beijingensis]|uniref:gluconokinase n=1 Tax=Telluria beijingensis TaxID=3068633 RepID=UPI0027960997|nr:gluconokinase [Massilia sp. REN29]